MAIVVFVTNLYNIDMVALKSLSKFGAPQPVKMQLTLLITVWW